MGPAGLRLGPLTPAVQRGPADTDSPRGLLCGQTVGSGSQPACNAARPFRIR